MKDKSEKFDQSCFYLQFSSMQQAKYLFLKKRIRFMKDQHVLLKIKVKLMFVWLT